MEKISQAEVGELLKTAGASLRAMKERCEELGTKVAHYERKERAEKIAHAMEEKGIQPELSFTEKVASVLTRENLDVVEEAVNLGNPHIKTASIHEDNLAVSEYEGNQAEMMFITGLVNQ